MRLLKSRLAWKRWVRAEGMAEQDSQPDEPSQYPCFAYAIVLSYGYEEQQPVYIYRSELNRMCEQMKKTAR
ncbi:MAG TPA: hypothetical protein VJU84_08735 [Pyrinomonadaceae bacterium]|nr:hypothetical protein [Pyrinomonadaceae bacterium]